MPWSFVGRAEQLGQVCGALENPASGPVVVAGERGMGRTALISRVLARVDQKNTRVVQVTPAGSAPLSSLRARFPQRVPPSASPDDAAREVGRGLGARTVLVADDAHLMDHASVLALRSLSRLGDAVLLVSHPVCAQPAARQDPTDCLAYERDATTIVLPPFTVAEVASLVGHYIGGTVRDAAAEALQAVTGGNPMLLRELLAAEGLAGSMVPRQGMWSLGPVDAGAGGRGGGGRGAGGRRAADLPRASTARLADAIGSAWHGLAIDRLDQLCKVALWCGEPGQVDLIWPFLLLLRGNADEAIGFVDSLGDGAIAAKPQLALVKAMALAIGRGEPRAASMFLLAAASSGIGPPGLLTAYRAWLLTVAGLANEAAGALRAIRHVNRETALFVHAARAGVTRLGGNAAETVFHLRRALATAESCRDSCPWMWPYLSACLADALVVAGRGAEVDSVATRLRPRESASGRYVGYILRALALCCEKGVPAVPIALTTPAVPAPPGPIPAALTTPAVPAAPTALRAIPA